MNWKTRLTITAAMLVVIALPASASRAQEIIGTVKVAHGEALVIRVGASLPALPGFKLQSNDTLQTGPDGRMGVLFRDDSALSLGPGSHLVIDRFVFNPAQGSLAMVTRVIRGTVAYLSGLIGKLSPESVKFETPVASIGLRGTHLAMQVEPAAP